MAGTTGAATGDGLTLGDGDGAADGLDSLLGGGAVADGRTGPTAYTTAPAAVLPLPAPLNRLAGSYGSCGVDPTGNRAGKEDARTVPSRETSTATAVLGTPSGAGAVTSGTTRPPASSASTALGTDGVDASSGSA